MERLTEWNGGQTRHAYYPRCFEEPCYGSGCKIKDCPFETAVCERLAAYEDTGLEPEAVETVKLALAAKHMVDLETLNNTPISRLVELAEADKDGRVIILPCKVYETDGVRVYEHTVREVIYETTCGPAFDKNAIGKSIFLTRAEAERALQEMEWQMKNRLTVRHGMLSDLRAYLKQSGWKLEEPVGEYEVLRARNPNYPRPLLVHNRAERGVGYTIDGRDAKIYSGWKRNRRKRCLDPDWPTQEEQKRYFEGVDGV